MKFEETRNISAVVQIQESKFSDDKEITELFKYVFEQSALFYSLHPPMNFKITYDNGGYRVCTFVLTLQEECEKYVDRLRELQKLLDDYDRIEVEYIKFKKFGDIETGALIRRRP